MSELVFCGGRSSLDLEWEMAEDAEIDAWVAREAAAQIAELEAAYEAGYREGYNDGHDTGMGNGCGHRFDDPDDWARMTEWENRKPYPWLTE